MVKNKKVLILFLILAALILGIVLSSVFFTVSRFEIQYQSSPNFRLETDYSEATQPYLGKSVLFFNPSDLKKEIEKKFPYARVVEIGKDVSRTVTVKLAERYEYFWFRNGDDYAVLDRELKVLRTGSGQPDSIDGVDMPVEVILPANAVVSAGAGETAVFSKDYISVFLKSFVSQITPYAENEFAARQSFGKIDLNFSQNVYVWARRGLDETSLGCRFSLISSAEKTDLFTENMFLFYYTKFNDAERECAEASIQFQSDKIQVVYKPIGA